MASRSPTIIQYPGSKAKIATRILRECAPPAEPTTLVDAMCGSAAWGLVAHAAYPRARLWLNDISADLVRVLVAIRDHPERLARQLELTPYSRWLWRQLRSRSRDGKRAGRDAGDVDLACADVLDWLILNLQSVGGTSSTVLPSTGWSRDLLGKNFRQWHRLPNLLRAMSRELCANTVIECLDFEDLLFGGKGQRFGVDSPTTWVYVDPPYPGREHYYGQAGGVEFHQRLASVLSRCQSWVTVSYADTPEYRATVAPLYRDWHRVEFTAVQYMSVRGKGISKSTRVEVLLCNYAPGQGALAMEAS